MTIYFANEGHIDLDTVRTMGVSIKGEGAIGYFGTGIKYALATLLRTDHRVELEVSGEVHKFTTRPKEIRGKMFDMIYMNDEQLAFTTDLGRDWEVWMAYRELHSNCLDEDGKISRSGWIGDTTWRISGPEIEKAYDERHKIFLHGDPAWVTDGLEVYRGISNNIFYRGVRIHRLVKPTRMTYNLTCPIELTEDRTAKSSWDISYKLASKLPTIADPEFCSKLISPGADTYDQALEFSHCGTPSEEFLDEVEKHFNNARLSPSAKELLLSSRKVNTDDTITLTDVEKEDVRKALSLIQHLNCHLEVDEIHFVEHLGAGIYGKMESGRIFIPRQTIANGVDFLAITIWEEFLHRDLALRDETRAMQQYLFDKILALIKEK
jgi:hypothetical protein